MRKLHKPRRVKRNVIGRPCQCDRTMTTILNGQDKASIRADLESLLNSSTWNTVKAILAEEVFTHASAMRAFLRKTSLQSEAAYELGAMEAFEHVHSKMLTDFVEALKTGHLPGLLEDVRPEEEGEAQNPPPEGQTGQVGA